MLDEVLIIGLVLLGFGFLGYVVPVAPIGSIIDMDNLCSSSFGQLGKVINEQVAEKCSLVSVQSKLIYLAIGIGGILIIVGSIMPSKKQSMFICGECNIAFSTVAELYNHDNSKEHLEKISQMSNDVKKSIEYKRKKQIPLQERLRHSPTLQGVIIGIIMIGIFWGVFSLFGSQSFTMGNDALSPDVLKGDMIRYQRIPFNEIKEGDIIAFPTENKEFSVKVGIVRKIVSENFGQFFVQTSSNANPDTKTDVFEKDYIGKITSIIPGGGSVLAVYSFPTGILITSVLFVSPIIILKIRKKFKTKNKI